MTTKYRLRKMSLRECSIYQVQYRFFGFWFNVDDDTIHSREEAMEVYERHATPITVEYIALGGDDGEDRQS